MLYFIPAWYKQNMWCENEQQWYMRRLKSEFDETIKQITLFHRNVDRPYRILVLGYSPNFRHFLHRQGMYRSKYWSCFDAIAQVRRKKVAVLSYHDIKWPKGLEDTNIGQLLMGFIILIILTSLILGIHIFLSYMSERSNQQGILMSLGFSNSYIFSAYFLEGFILIIIGCVLGLILGRYITILIFKLIQSLRTIPLEHFAPQFQPISYMVIWGICVLDFIVGICPVLIYRSRMKMIDIMKGGKNNYKVKDKRGSEKGNIMMRYSIQIGRASCRERV